MHVQDYRCLYEQKKKKKKLRTRKKKKKKKPLEFHFFFLPYSLLFTIETLDVVYLLIVCLLAHTVYSGVNIQVNASVSVRLSDVAANYSMLLCSGMNINHCKEGDCVQTLLICDGDG